jgi:hypothetical protein
MSGRRWRSGSRSAGTGVWSGCRGACSNAFCQSAPPPSGALRGTTSSEPCSRASPSGRCAGAVDQDGNVEISGAAPVWDIYGLHFRRDAGLLADASQSDVRQHPARHTPPPRHAVQKTQPGRSRNDQGARSGSSAIAAASTSQSRVGFRPMAPPPGMDSCVRVKRCWQPGAAPVAWSKRTSGRLQRCVLSSSRTLIRIGRCSTH